MTNLDTYTQRMSVHRASLLNDEQMLRITDPAIDPDVFLRFMIEFCSRGIAITKPVADWIERAGQRTKEAGLERVGTLLVKHAKQEAGHHEMQVTDTAALVKRFNNRTGSNLDSATLLARPVQQAASEYITLHEDVIASDQPFRQVAIEREIEGLSVMMGPAVVEQCARQWGAGGLSDASFLTEHVELDVGHTAFNEKLVALLLEARPDAFEPLVETGRRALDIYRRFLAECLDVAEREVIGSWPTQASRSPLPRAASAGSVSRP